ncbi:MAG: GNAT family acetyltransferase [Rhodobacteraceae bacterium]|nr:GNAT family acetyltransferase [Paracoccaceae bacterium]
MSVKPYRIAEFEEQYRTDVIALWKECGLYRPWNDPDKDIDRKLGDEQGQFWILFEGEAGNEHPVGSIMIGYDGHRGSIYYLCVSPDCQGRGYGKILMREAEAFLLSKGCPKVNLMVRKGNEPVLSFYDKLGYGEDEAVPLGKRLIPDN